MKRLLLIALLFIAGAGVGLGADKVLVDGTAAIVGKGLLTVQDAYFYRGLQRLREGTGDPLTREKGEELRKTVQRMALEEMVTSEIKSFKYDGGGLSDAQRLIASWKTKDKESRFRAVLIRFSRSESAAVERLAKSYNVERFLQKKVETLTPIITEAEAERYFTQNQARFANSSFESLKDNITLLLKKERMEKGLEEWVRFLKDKYGLVNLLGS